MDDLLNLHADGVFLRREALAHGYVDDELRRHLLGGILARVRHGAYMAAPTWQAASPEQQHRLRAHAVLRSHKSALVLSHTSAAVEHGLRLFRPALERVHVNCTDKPLSRTTRDVVYHYPGHEVTAVDLLDGVLAVPPAQAAVEAASVASVQQAVVVLDSALDLMPITPGDLIASYEQRRRWPGSRHLQVAMRLARPGSNSVGESLMRYLMWRFSIPEPQLQYEVRSASGDLLGITDFAWPEYGVLGEFDGMVKYTTLLRPGESSAQALKREKVREDRIREQTGCLMIRFIWDDIFTPAVTAERIKRQLRAGAKITRATG